jgi:hypothetical protein
MATTPVPVLAPVPVPAATSNPVSTFLKAHEKLIILVLCLLVGWHFYAKAVSAWESYDQRKDNLAHAALAADVTTANQIATVNAQEAADYKVLAAQLAASNTALASARVTRAAATQTQQAADRTLPPTELATRWTTLLKMPPGTVLVEPGGKGVPDALVITPAGATETVLQLETVPMLQADLQDETTVATNYSTQVTSLERVNVGLNTQIDALDAEIITANAACVADKKLLVAKARKSKLHWFEAGVVVGFVGRQLIKTFGGI